MTTLSWDAQGEVQAALRTIVADPRLSAAAGAVAAAILSDDTIL